MTKTSKTQAPRGESFRVPIDCVVDLRLNPTDDWIRTAASNISMSGMFLRTAKVQPRGARLDVKFRLQDGKSPIHAQVEVLWSRVRDTGPETPRGLGVRFLDLDLESKYAISRLVDRYQQLGRTPFHLTPAEEESLAAKTDSKHGRRALILAFVAGAVSGVLASYLWIAKPASPVADSQPRAAMAKTEAEAEPIETPAQMASAPSALPVNPTDTIETAVRDWAQAWAGKDVERYLDAYLEDFAPASGLPHDAWETQRRERLSRAGSIEISLSTLEIDVLAPERAVVRFDQAYSATGYQDQVKKQLELVLREHVWKISREEVRHPSRGDKPIQGDFR